MGLAARIEILFFCERHIAFMKSWAARIEITFFCERHVALIPLGKTKLCAWDERLLSKSCTFVSDTSRLYHSIKRNYVKGVSR